MIAPLLRTKLHMPRSRARLVDRGRLSRVLDAGADRRVTLLSAPAGFGKTTLTTAWLASLDRPVAWLSLDDGDNDPARFVRYLVAALRGVAPGAGASLEASLQSPQPPPLPVLLTELLNDLLDAPPLVLVLDDLHAIREAAVYDALAFLVEHLPDHVHLVLTTRTDPPLPLSRLRARGELTELRASDLRFTGAEAAEFLRQTLGLTLRTASVEALTERTEGWAVGLQMAGVSLQGGDDPDAFVDAFGGSNRYVLDYLVDEVLGTLDGATQDFLLRTSILDRLHGPLCDAILDGAPGGSSDEMLRRLDRDNLFVVPLDGERRWFRYHHLFADLLQVRAAPRLEDELPALHGRAAAWFDGAGDVDRALHHALVAGEDDRAAALVEQHAVPALARGEIHTVLGWVARLPEELPLTGPGLDLALAWAAVFTGQFPRAAEALARASERVPDAATTAEIAVIRALMAVLAGDAHAALALAEGARPALTAEQVLAEGVLAWAEGYAARTTGNLPRARALFEEGARVARRRGSPWGEVMATTDLSTVLEQQGRLHDAIEVCRAALAHPDRVIQMRLHMQLANLLRRRWALDEAWDHVQRARAMAPHWDEPNYATFVELLAAQVCRARGDDGPAEAALLRADAARANPATLPALALAVDAELLRVALLRDDVAAATRWVDPDAVTAGLGELEPDLLRRKNAARLEIARGGDAAPLLNDLERVAHRDGRGALVLDVQVLRTLAALAAGDDDGAREVLREAVALAEPERFVSTFLDEADALTPTLERVVSAGGPTKAYAQRLLSAARRGAVTEPPPVPTQAPAAQPLIDPLSERELEVLALIAEGLTNPQIGKRLFIAPGTVKAHSAAIYRKLDVANRTQAVARARELGLL